MAQFEEFVQQNLLSLKLPVKQASLQAFETHNHFDVHCKAASAESSS